MTYALWIDGKRAALLGAHSAPTYELNFDGGCGELGVEFVGATAHMMIPEQADVRLVVDGWPVYAGYVSDWEPRTGALTAQGYASMPKAALNFDGDPTRDVGQAVSAAISRGWPVTNPDHVAHTWNGSAWIPNWLPSDPDAGPLMLADALDLWAESQGYHWGVDGRGVLYARPNPTTPAYRMTPAATAFGASDAEVAHVLVGKYKTTIGSATVVHGSGPIEVIVDLTPHGEIDAAAATATLAGALARANSGGVTWLEGVDLTGDQLLHSTGAPTHPASVEPGAMVRASGLPVLATGSMTLDAVIGRTIYTAGSPIVRIEPLASPASTLADALAAAS